MSSIACQQACVLLDHRDCDRVVVSVVEALCDVWVSRSVLGGVSWVLVVGCGYVVNLIGSPPCAILSVPTPPPWLCSLGKIWASSAGVVASDQHGLLHFDNRCAAHLQSGSSLGRRRCVEWVDWVVLSCIRDVDWNFSASCAVARQSWLLCL